MKIHPTPPAKLEDPGTTSQCSSSTNISTQVVKASTNFVPEMTRSSTAVFSDTMSRSSLSMDSSLNILRLQQTLNGDEGQPLVKRVLRRVCPAPHSLQNVLMLIFLLQTFICIGSMIVLIQSSGDKSIEDISTIQSDAIALYINTHISTSKAILQQLHQLLSNSNHFFGDSIPNLQILSKRVLSLFAPTKLGYPMTTQFYYGNSLRNFISIEMTQTRQFVLIRDEMGTVITSTFNEFYEPVKEYQRNPNYDTLKRDWYKAGLKKQYPDYQWSNIFSRVTVKGICIAACTTVNYSTYNYTMNSQNGTLEKNPVTQVIGVHFDMIQMDFLLNQTILQFRDVQTKTMDIVIVERSGYIVTSSIGVIQDTSTQRVHLNSTSNDVFFLIYNELVNRNILYGVKGPSNSSLLYSDASSSNTTTIVLFVQGHRVSVKFINDGHGIDWVMILSAEKYGFVKTVFTSSPELLSLSIVLVVCGSLLAVVLTQIVSYSIMKVARDMSRIARLQVDQVKSSRVLKTVHELDMLQQSTKLVKSALHSFMKYIPRDIVKDIVKNGVGAKLGVASCNTSIMFTDIADFTNFSESSHVNVLLKVLSEYFRIITEAVEANHGVIDKFIGDGTMSLFSHPLYQVDDHAERCCHAALQALTEIEKFRHVCKRKGWPEVRIRVGINTGNAMIGNVGSKERFNYTAIGDTVNTAGRLETLNKRYDTTILIGQNTYELISKKFVCLFVDVIKLKGKARPIEVFTLESEISQASKKQLAVQDALLQAKDFMAHRKYMEMNETLDTLIENLDEWIDTENHNRTYMDEVMELNAFRSSVQFYGNPNICFSNLNFVKELRKRGKELQKLSQSTTVVTTVLDYSLTLNEK
ncbi:hypothetical protein C9374_010015 [Naegleria lovaniensis]|uniref:Guanylate cyclase domain-containing protein n=1 Tax=Naegleria lovaniensis TaxID=51637 RepID=A0AA88GDA1_NAELO|nr:uncharacterized protein C9374_010015 [Naegleria lovaniensis]KAG2375392.1 hypothetical protein C9374_010015 [Naegleria lovaniensis]